MTDDLNPQQRQVAEDPEHRDGARCVISGPGSGKTKTMVYFYKKLRELGVPMAAIRGVTFSKEMADAIEKRSGSGHVFSTFHSLGYEICREIGHKPVEPELRHRLMVRLVKRWGLEYKELDRFISAMRRSGTTPQQVLDDPEIGRYAWARAYQDYEQTRAAEGWIDFDSMICDAVHLLETNKVIRNRWQFQYLIVDEAQDTDNIQWRMMQLLSEKYGNITVVGDPNQCQPGGTKVLILKQPKYGHYPAQLAEVPIETLKDGDAVLSWTRSGQRIFHVPRKIKTASRMYSGDLIQLRTGDKTTRVTPNHFIWVRWNKKALQTKVHFVYLMWRPDLGFRVGTSTVRTNRSGGCFLSLRARQEKAERMWILDFVATKQEAVTREEQISLTYRIPECMFEAHEGKKTEADIKSIFTCADPEGGFKCLNSCKLLFDYPLWTKPDRGVQTYHGYFKTAAANAIPGLMVMPTTEVNGSAQITGTNRISFCGLVYSMEVEKDHTYVADGIPVGNCIYGFRGAQPDNLTHFTKWFPRGRYYFLGLNYRSTESIVDFIRQNAPEDTPLTEQMFSARRVKGVPIGMKMYWRDTEEAEAAITLAQSDPKNSIILARTNRVIGLLEGVCAEHNIRYHLLGKTGFWKRNEIRKALETLKTHIGQPTSRAIESALPTLERKYAVDDRTEQDNDALDNLRRLREISKRFATTKEFLDYGRRMVHRRNDPNGVTLSTIHQAKGGEWTNVYLIGAKDGAIPHKSGELREEKRIYFVAISRPKDVLRISWSGTPSPLLRPYLPEEVLDELREHAQEVERLKSQRSLFGG